MSSRTSLRALAVIASATAALLAPATAAFADSSPAPLPKVDLSERAGGPAQGTALLPRGGVAAGDKPQVVNPAEKPRTGWAKVSATMPPREVAAGDKPRVAPRDTVWSTSPQPMPLREGAVTPRGGVAAGERPAERDGSGALIGTAAGIAALAAGAGTLVVRRRYQG
ncbi:hypothetical protein ACFVIM_07840 [Streptomyces sp. NPDC057638]|uniref:hypothetical protein n=1 Tax=Streptomyces sp. NPDC057638 TaxID=3346190 RepID=UPI0036AC277D